MKQKVLVIDVGGTHVKALASGRRAIVQADSGPDLTPRQMATRVLDMTGGWQYDVVSIGYPGPVVRGRIVREPRNLGRGWVGFDFERAFGRPVRVINDAAMQAIGSYEGRRMLFLGLGTGLGTTLVRDGIVIPLELAHLPYEEGRSYEEVVGDAGLHLLGLSRWRAHVARVVALLMDAVVVDYTVLGGGNVRHVTRMPARTRRGANTNAMRGGFRLWHDDVVCT